MILCSRNHLVIFLLVFTMNFMMMRAFDIKHMAVIQIFHKNSSFLKGPPQFNTSVQHISSTQKGHSFRAPKTPSPGVEARGFWCRTEGFGSWKGVSLLCWPNVLNWGGWGTRPVKKGNFLESITRTDFKNKNFFRNINFGYYYLFKTELIMAILSCKIFTTLILKFSKIFFVTIASSFDCYLRFLFRVLG